MLILANNKEFKPIRNADKLARVIAAKDPIKYTRLAETIKMMSETNTFFAWGYDNRGRLYTKGGEVAPQRDKIISLLVTPKESYERLELSRSETKTNGEGNLSITRRVSSGL